RPLGVDDDLRVGDVGDRVERRGANRVDAQAHARDEQRRDQASETHDPIDQGRDHGYSEPPFSLLSASTKKLPIDTIWSPSASPSSTCVYSSPSMPVWIVRGAYSPPACCT